MEEEDYIDVTLPHENPWRRGPTVRVSRAEATRIADIAAGVAEQYRDKFNVAFQYNRPVFEATKEHMPEEDQQREAMYRAVASVLSKRANRGDWYDGNYAAYRCFQSRNAYATPGFAEARRNSEMYGS